MTPPVGRGTPSDQGKLALFAELVRDWAPRINLVAATDLPDFERRHIEDALRLAPLVRRLPPGPAVDVGSGAGLPGIPLAIADPARRWRLVEPREKRAAFLELVVRTLELNCEVVVDTAQECARREDFVRAHQLATARALAPPARVFALLTPLVVPGGIAAVWLGAKVPIPAGATRWLPGIARMTVEMNAPDGDD